MGHIHIVKFSRPISKTAKQKSSRRERERKIKVYFFKRITTTDTWSIDRSHGARHLTAKWRRIELLDCSALGMICIADDFINEFEEDFQQGLIGSRNSFSVINETNDCLKASLMILKIWRLITQSVMQWLVSNAIWSCLIKY